MDVLNRVYSTVSSTVSQLSGVLPGNPVTREYEVINHIASAGPGLLWKIYSGYKKSTRQPASIFVFEKRLVVPQDKEVVVETLKRGIAQLTKLRHPQILVVQHPLEESRESLAFATEPVFSSLANLLGRTDNMPQNKEHISGYKLYDIEIKYGLLQVGEGLVFLHKDAKIIHHNLCPESIIVNHQGAWKIFGFDFAVHNTSSDSSPCWPCIDYRKVGNDIAQPDLEFLAPECGLSERLCPASDIFSLAILIYSIYNSGMTLFTARDWRSYTSNVSQVKSLPPSKLQSIPDGLRDIVKLMLNSTPELRPDEHEFIKIQFFEDIGVKALNYLDSLFQWDNRQKSHFYKGLPQILDKLPHRVSLYRVLPCLVKEFVNPIMVPFVLPNVFSIAETCSKQEYAEHIHPHLRPVMALQEPIQILLIFMQKMEVLLKMTPGDDVKADVLPLLYRALESDAVEIQELCLSVLPNFASLIEYPAMKNALLPRIKRLCISTTSISVRVNCLVCVGKLLDNLDKWLVLDEILPFLPQIPSKEPAVLMGILGIYKLVLNHKKMSMSKELMATKVIPFLMPLSIENSLTLNQFNTIISVIKDMVSRVETDQRVKLEQLQAVQQETKSLENSLNSSSTFNSSEIKSESAVDLETLFGMNKVAEKPSSSTPLQSKPLENLTLQDKQKIVADSEAAKRLQNSNLLTPKPVAAAKSPNQIKDLTATLMSSGLTNDAPKKTFPQQNWSIGRGKEAPLPWNGSTQVATQSWGMTSPPMTGSQPTWTPPQNQGWSANTTMKTWNWPNSTSSFPSPTIQQNSSTNASAKPLSKSEINDFLS